MNKKNILWNIIGATTNAFNSLFFSIIVTRINGVNDAGIFIYSFATACLLYVIGIYAGRTFQVTDISKKYSDTDYLYNKVITCIIMITVSIGFVILKQYDIYKSVIFVLVCLFKVIEAFSEGLYGIIQKNDQLYKVGKSMTLKSIVGLIVFFIVNLITKNLILACISLAIVNIVIAILYDKKNIGKIEITKTKYSWKANKQLLIEGFFTFVLTFLSLYVINAARYAIDDLLEESLQTVFGVIIMPATFMGLLGQYIIQPALSKITSYLEKEDYKGIKKITIFLLGFILVIGILIFIVAYFLEAPILGYVYGIDLKPYFVSMMIIIAGSILYSMSTILSTVLIAMRSTKIQALLYFIVSVIATVLSYNLVKRIGIKGASITYFVTMLILTITFILCVLFNISKKNKSK